MSILQHAGFGALVIAFFGGIVSFFSPCVAPLVPGYISYLSGTALQTSADGGPAPVIVRRAIALPLVGSVRVRLSATSLVSLLFVGGFSATFVLLGLVAGSVGGLLVAYRPVMQTLAGIVMLAMGAFLLGLLPRAWTDALLRERRFHLKPGALGGWGLAAPFLFGMVFAAGWTPCIGPVLAAIYTYAGASGSPLVGLVLLLFYSLGFAVPFLAVGMGSSAGLRALGWAKRYGHTISLVSGALLVIVGLLYLTGQVSIFSTWAGQVTLPVIH
jgi:cytochrome c-type biogenesis protein